MGRFHRHRRPGPRPRRAGAARRAHPDSAGSLRPSPQADFHDITVGYNFYDAGPGYDLVTGLGTPIANKLIPDLAAYGAATEAVVAYEPPSDVNAGGIFGTVVEVTNKAGQPAFGFTRHSQDLAALAALA